MHRTGNAGISCIVAGFLLAPGVQAATADASDQLEGIIVVGQKENQSIQKAPEAITALSAETLQQAGIHNSTELNGMVPSLVIGESDGYNFDLSIRGIGLNSPQDDGSPASVSLHQNGIFIPNPLSLSFGFLDVDHLEVLRGPQGTVFGQNSVGGTVNIITVQPTLDEVKGYANLELGSFDLKHFKTALNLPLSSTFAIRFAGDFIKQDGYVVATEVPGDFHLNDAHNYHVRLSALFQPGDDFNVVASVEYVKVVQHEPQSKNILDPNPNPYQESSDWPGLYNIDQTIGSVVATYNFDAMTFKSLSSVQYMNQGGSNSEGGLDVALSTALYGGENVQYVLHKNYAVTQEFDLSSKPGGPLDWVVGAFYLDTRTTDGYDQYLRNPSDPGAPDILNNQQESLVAQQIADGTLYFESSNSFRRTSISGFGQGIYHLTDQLRATAGFRYTVDHNSTLLDNYFGDPSIWRRHRPSASGFGQADLEGRSRLPGRAGESAVRQHLHRLQAGRRQSRHRAGGGPAELCPGDHHGIRGGVRRTRSSTGRWSANFAGFYYIDKNMQYHAEDLINFDGGVDNLPKVLVYGLEGEFSGAAAVQLPAQPGTSRLRHGKIATHVSTLDNLAGNAANSAFAT